MTFTNLVLAFLAIGGLVCFGAIVFVLCKALAPALAERRELADLQRVVMERGEAAGIKTATPRAVRRWLKSLTQEERRSLRAICATRAQGECDAEQYSRSGA